MPSNIKIDASAIFEKQYTVANCLTRVDCETNECEMYLTAALLKPKSLKVVHTAITPAKIAYVPKLPGPSVLAISTDAANPITNRNPLEIRTENQSCRDLSGLNFNLFILSDMVKVIVSVNLIQFLKKSVVLLGSE